MLKKIIIISFALLNTALFSLSSMALLAQEITGDEVVGLRSCLLARAQSTMVSLWYVRDLSTSALMTDSYSQLQNNSEKPQALR